MNNRSNIKYCPNCGHATSKDTQFCSNCGYKFKNVQNNERSTSIPPTRIARRNIKNKTTNNHKMNNRTKWIVGIIIAIILLGGIGMGIHHHNSEVHRQATIQRQKSNSQQNNQTQNQPQSQSQNQNNSQIINGQHEYNMNSNSKHEQIKDILSQYLDQMRVLTTNDDKITKPNGQRVLNTKPLATFYEHRTQNPSFKQMFKWCQSQSSNHTPIMTAIDHLHIHYLGNKDYQLTYNIDYIFTHQQPQDDFTTKNTHKYQTVTWHTTIRNDSSFHWNILKSYSDKNVTKPTTAHLVKVGLLEQGQHEDN